MNKENLKNYKTYVGLFLFGILLIGGIALDASGGFLCNVVAAAAYIGAGSVAGITTYYIFLEEKSY